MIKEIADISLLLDITNDMIKKGLKPGFDGMSAEGAMLWFKINRDKIIKLLLSGEYEPMPIVGFHIAKSSGKCRSLGITTAIDTIIQYAIIKSLKEKAEKTFSNYSFAYRTGMGVATALEAYCELSSKFRYAALIDTNDCFGNIDHAILYKQLQELTHSEAAASLIINFAKSPLLVDGEIIPHNKGIHQGAPISPLLCNIYMDTFDKYLSSLGIRFIRYADDTVIFGDTVSELQKYIEQISLFLKNSLNLTVNTRKSCIKLCSEMTFLGHTFKKDKSGILSIQTGSTFDNICRYWNSTSIQKMTVYTTF